MEEIRTVFNPSTTRAYILCGIVVESIDSHAASGVRSHPTTYSTMPIYSRISQTSLRAGAESPAAGSGGLY